MRDFASPLDWYHAAADQFPASWWTALNARPSIGWAIGLCIVGAIVPGFLWKWTRPGFVRGLQWILVAAVMLIACECLYLICYPLAEDAILTGKEWHSLWQPRYIGFVWPAMAIAVSALIMRLPTRPVRWLAILIFLGINLAFGFARIFGRTEPPVDQMAADVYAAQDNDSQTRTYTDIRTWGFTPSLGTLNSFPGRYYLQMNAWHQPMTPPRFRDLLSEFVFRDYSKPDTISNEVAENPQVNHVIVWDEYEERPKDADDTLTRRLNDWTLQNESWYPLRVFWDWEDVTNFRRREYLKVIPPRSRVNSSVLPR